MLTDALVALVICLGISVSFAALGTEGGALVTLGTVALAGAVLLADWYRHRRRP